MPASRSAAAITRAPRSWPARPGFATSTRILRSIRSEPRRGLVDAELLLERRRDLAHRAICAHRVADAGLHVPGAGCRRGQPERARLRLLAVALAAHAGHALPGVPRGFGGGAGDLHLRL